MANILHQTVTPSDLETPNILKYVPPLLGGHEWGIRTTLSQKRQLKALERRLLRVNAEHFNVRSLYVYFDLDYDGMTDKIWIVQFLHFAEEKNRARFDYLIGEWYDLQLENDGYSQLFLFDEFLFDEEFDSIFNSKNKKAAIRKYKKSKKPKREKAIQFKVEENQKKQSKTKKRKKINVTVSMKKEPVLIDSKKKIKDDIVCTQKASGKNLNSEFGVKKLKYSAESDCKEGSSSEPSTTAIPPTPRIMSNAPLKRMRNRIKKKHINQSKNLRKRKLEERDSDDDQKQIESVQCQSIKYYESFQYYHCESGRNRYINQKETQRAPEKMSLDYGDYETDEWWNDYNLCDFHETRYPDPGICPLDQDNLSNLSSQSTQCRPKMTRYPPPPVYESFCESPGSAPFPYIVRQSMIDISSSEYTERIYKYLKNRTIHVVPRKSMSESMRPKRSTFSRIFSLKKRGIDCSLGLTAKAETIGAFTIGDVYAGDALSDALVIEHEEGLEFMNEENDIFRGHQIGNVHFATFGARTPWHHDLGLCAWLSMISGEKNIKLWDVKASRQVEEYTNDLKLGEVERKRLIRSVHPRWEVFLRAGCTLILPAGMGHLVTTTSDIAVMGLGCYMTRDQLRIGYQMAQYESLRYRKKEGLDWDVIVEGATNEHFEGKKKVSIEKRLQYLETNERQHNWNIDY